MAEPLVVSKREAIIDFLRNEGFVPDDVRVIRGNVRPRDVEGCDVFGHLPYRLAASAESITEVGMPPTDPTYNYSPEQLRRLATVRRYTVREIPLED